MIDEHVEQGRDDEACRDDGEAIDRVEQTVGDLDRARKEFGNGNAERRRAPDELHALVQEQDHAESGEHLIEMIAVVEVAEHQNFEQQPEGQRRGQGEKQRPAEASCPGAEGRDQIGADHVLHAVRQVDEIHHAEHEGQAGGDEKEDEPELKAVQSLDEEKSCGHRHVTCRRPSSIEPPLAMLPA